MIKKLFLPLLLIIATQSIAQDIFSYIDSNIYKIRTINPGDSNYADLEPIGSAIGDSRIVLMGEQDHGDAPTFLAKARLIRYLHEKKGFDIVAFESDFYNLERPVTQTNYQKFSSIYSIWTQCLECKPTFDYILKEDFSKKPLILTGFDSRHKGTNNKLYIKEFIKTYRIDTTLEQNRKLLSIIFEVLENEYTSKCSAENKAFFLSQIDTLIGSYPTSSTNGSFNLQELMNLKSYARTAWMIKDKNSSSYDTRDRQMASNLLWLAQSKYPDKKIIVWAHSYHIAKNFQLLSKKEKQSTNMGTQVFPMLKNDMYVLGFTSLAGKAGRVIMEKKFTIKVPTSKCPELLFAKKNINYGFVDFKKYPNRNSMQSYKMKLLGHLLKKAVWHQMFDGVFYIQDMYPCEKKSF